MEYQIPMRRDRISTLEHDEGQLRRLTFDKGEPLKLEAAFTTRGDVYHNDLTEGVGASTNTEEGITVDSYLRANVAGLYAANCQMIIAAGQGARAGQAINRDLFEESLRNHSVPVWAERTCVGSQYG